MRQAVRKWWWRHACWLAAILAVFAASAQGAPPQAIRIRGFVDFPFGLWYATMPEPAGSSNICVFVRNPPGSYFIVATSAHAAGTVFRLFSAPDRCVEYGVGWTDHPDGNMGSSTAWPTPFGHSGQQSARQTGAADQPNCNRGDTATLSVLVPAANLIAAPYGTYTDTLTILAIPE